MLSFYRYRPLTTLLSPLFLAFGIAGSHQILAQEGLEYQTRQLNGIGFRYPSALELELVAAPPLVKWPIVGDWDDQGRLVLVESDGVEKNVVEQTKTRPHRMIRLVDDDGDGKFDRRILAAVDLGFPEGVLCLGKQTLVSTPPQILSLVDNDGDGVCEERSVWFDGMTLTGCANDLHGPYLGRDGWIYWCKGAFAEQKHTLASGNELVSKAAHVFRRRLEGGPLEPVMTGGMDNPVELAITPEGERFFTSTFLQNPSGGKRDGIAHAVYGGVYGKDHPAVLNGKVRTGPLMPIMTHLGPAAPSGLICLNSKSITSQMELEDPSANVLAAAQFNLQRLSLHALRPEGASFVTQDIDILLGDRIDFHPTDVIEDADGSLVVVDTGGWYDLCCPSSGVDQEKALGGIYRLRSRKGSSTGDPRGNLLDRSSPAGLVKQLSDERWWVRQEAAKRLERAFEPSLSPALVQLFSKGDLSRQIRLETLWLLCRLNAPGLEEAINSALQDKDPSLRQAALHIISVRKLPHANWVHGVLSKDNNAQVLRVAAEAIGRVGNEESVDLLMQVLERPFLDRFLQHSVYYALIELDRQTEVAKYLESPSLSAQTASLVVLDQLQSPRLTAEVVVAKIQAKEEALRTAAIEALSKRPEWSTSVSSQIEALAASSNDDLAARRGWLAIAATWHTQPVVQRTVDRMIRKASHSSASEQSLLIQSLQQMRLKELNAEWDPFIDEWLKNSNAEARGRVADWMKGLSYKEDAFPKVVNQLIMLAGDLSKKEQFAFLAALPEGCSQVPSKIQTRLIDEMVANQGDDTARHHAAQALQKIRLATSEVDHVLENLSKVPALYLVATVTSIQRLQNDETDLKMFERLKETASVRSLPPDGITSLYRNRSPKVKSALKSIVDQINAPPVEIVAKLNKVESELPPGDPVRGFQVFRNAKAACAACHRIGYVGGNVGPDLSRIGASRTRRDLLEAVLFPSVRLEQSYQPTRILVSDGQVHNGLVKSETDKEIELIVGADRSVLIEKREIEARSPGSVSIMPAGLDQSISLQDLADLIALLESKK